MRTRTGVSRRINRLLSLLLCLPLLLAFSACKPAEPDDADDPSSSEEQSGGEEAPSASTAMLRSLLKQAENGKINLDCDTSCGYGEEQFEEYFSYLYDLSIDYVKDGCICYVASGVSADEVSLLRPADAGKGADITNALNARIAKRITDYHGYNDDEVAKLEKSVVTPIGPYIALIVADHPDTIEKAIRKLF